MVKYKVGKKSISYKGHEDLDLIFLEILDIYKNSFGSDFGRLPLGVNQWLVLSLKQKLDLLGVWSKSEEDEILRSRLAETKCEAEDWFLRGENEIPNHWFEIYSSSLGNRYLSDILCSHPESLFADELFDKFMLGKGEVSRAEKLQLAGHKDIKIRHFLALITSDPVILKTLVNSKGSYTTKKYMLHAILQNPATCEDIYRSIESDFLSGTKAQKISLGMSARTRPEILEQLAQDKNFEVRAAVARNERVTTKAIDILLDDKKEAVWSALASNKCIDSNTCDRLLETLNSKVLLLLCNNQSISKADLIKVVRVVSKEGLTACRLDRYSSVLYFFSYVVFSHVNCDDEVRDLLISNHAIQELMSNEFALIKFLDGEGDCYFDIAFKIYGLSDDPHHKIKRSFFTTQSSFDKLLNCLVVLDFEQKKRFISACESSLQDKIAETGWDEDLFEILAECDIDQVLRSLARNPKCPQSVLAVLEVHPSLDVRLVAACQKNKGEILGLLLNDKSNSLFRTLNISISSISSLTDRFEISMRVWNDKPFIKVLGSSSNLVNAGSLKKIIKSDLWEERFAAARNENLSEEGLVSLAGDENRIVANQAASSLAKMKESGGVKASSEIVSADSSYLSSLVSKLFNSCKSHSFEGEIDYTEETINSLNGLVETKKTWVLSLYDLDLEDLDRRSNMLGGVPYTSDKHPWPTSNGDIYLCPVIQINLSEVSELTKHNFGSGLFQVWLDISNEEMAIESRVISPKDSDGVPSPEVPDYMKKNKVYWDERAMGFDFVYAGEMCKSWEYGMSDWSESREELSDEEMSIILKIDEHVSKNSNVNKDYLLGYPDIGSGAPAGSYCYLPTNFIQFMTCDAYPHVDTGRLANVFVSGQTELFFERG